MTSREFHLERRKAELPIFLAVLKSLPADRLDYKPHDRSPSAEQLVWTLTSELRTCLEVVKENRTEWRQEPPPSFEEMLKRFEQWSEELIALVPRWTSPHGAEWPSFSMPVRSYRNSPQVSSSG